MHFWIDKRIPGYGYNPNPRYGPHSCVTGYRRNPHTHSHQTRHTHPVEVLPPCNVQEHINSTDNNGRHARQAISSIESTHGTIETTTQSNLPVNEENLDRIVRQQNNAERCNRLRKLKFVFWLTVAICMFLFTVLKNYTGMHIMGFGMIALMIFIPLLIITGVISIYKGISRLVTTEPPHSFIGYDGEGVVGVPVIRVTYVTETGPPSATSGQETAPSVIVDEQPPPPYDEAIKYSARPQKLDSLPPSYDKAVT